MIFQFKLAFCIFPLLSIAAWSQVQIGGDCSVNIANVSENAKITVEQGLCGDALKVTYLWLDGQNLALIESGLLTSSLRDAVGESPKLLRLGVSGPMREILDIATEDVLVGGFTSPFSYINTIIETSSDRVLSERDLEIMDIGESFPYFAGDDRILWPDLGAYKDFYEYGTWPRSSSYCYQELGSASYETILEQFSDENPNGFYELASRVTPISYVGELEVMNYWTAVRKLTEVFPVADTAAGSFPIDEYDYAEVFANDGDTITSKDWARATPRSFQLLEYLAGFGLPEDFLMRVGAYRQNDCAGIQGISFAAIPRRFQVLVAVVEPLTPAVRITSLQFEADRGTGLRSDFDLVLEDELEIALPELTQGESYVLPLRIEFKYNLEDERAKGISQYYTTPDEGAKLWSLIETLMQRFPKLTQPVGANPDGDARTLAGLRAPDLAPPTSVYYFGDVLSLESITTENVITGDRVRHSTRTTPVIALFSENGIDGASCPFLFFESDEGLFRLFGRVLVGAHSPMESRVERISIPNGTKAIHISEREPEVTYLRKVTLVVAGRTTLLARNVRLNPQDTLTLELPDGFPDAAAIEIEGYYSILN